MDTIYRHVAACNNAILPGGREVLLVAGQRVGWLAPALVEPVLALGGERVAGGIAVAGARLPCVARALAEAGQYRWRDEAFDVRAVPDGPVLSTLDRGALPSFGVQAVGVHLNALVRRPDGLWLWVARRAADKLLDPGKLDHLVAGGVPAGFSAAETLLKEAEEEAGVPATLLADANEVAVIDYAMVRDEGLRRDRLVCYDIELPSDFVPEARDGEVEGFELWPLPKVVARVRETEAFKFNVNLVLIDLFQRFGMV
jgi:8-oxo-dGTP pyrophosphatase MutT (NUDIX family)